MIDGEHCGTGQTQIKNCPRRARAQPHFNLLFRQLKSAALSGDGAFGAKNPAKAPQVSGDWHVR